MSQESEFSLHMFCGKLLSRAMRASPTPTSERQAGLRWVQRCIKDRLLPPAAHQTPHGRWRHWTGGGGSHFCPSLRYHLSFHKVAADSALNGGPHTSTGWPWEFRESCVVSPEHLLNAGPCTQPNRGKLWGSWPQDLRRLCPSDAKMTA